MLSWEASDLGGISFFYKWRESVASSMTHAFRSKWTCRIVHLSNTYIYNSALMLAVSWTRFQMQYVLWRTLYGTQLWWVIRDIFVLEKRPLRFVYQFQRFSQKCQVGILQTMLSRGAAASDSCLHVRCQTLPTESVQCLNITRNMFWKETLYHV